MPKVLVLYYSSYGHLAKMADAVAEGARGAGAEVDVRRVPETAPAEVAKAAGFQHDESHAELSDLDDPDLADVVLLPDEPYVFTASDGPEAFASVPTQLVSGRLITWYGPAMLEAATLWMNRPGSQAGRPY